MPGVFSAALLNRLAITYLSPGAERQLTWPGEAAQQLTLFQSTPALQSYSEGLQLLCKAYTAEPENAAVLNLLAHYSIVREEYTEVHWRHHRHLNC